MGGNKQAKNCGFGARWLLNAALKRQDYFCRSCRQMPFASVCWLIVFHCFISIVLSLELTKLDDRVCGESDRLTAQ